MQRMIIVTAALLASALGAHAAVKHHRWVVNGHVCHETVVTGKSDAIAYALAIASGEAAIPRMDEVRRCAPRNPDNYDSDEVNRNLSLGIY